MSLYHVRIELREPAFELRIGPRDEPFLAGYDVSAENRDDAVRTAIRQFHQQTAESRVGWQRVIQRVIVGEDPVPTRVWSAEGGLVTEPEPVAAAPEPEPVRPVRWATFPAEPPLENTAPVPDIEPYPVIEREPATEPTAPATEQPVWSALHTLAVVAGVGLGFYLGVKAARWKDAA